MSREIDQRVVEMRFDNANFEQKVSRTMSVLDKFEQKLNFSGAVKGVEEFESISSANFQKVEDSTNKLQASFSAMEVVAITALANITNSAINTGKQLAKSLTVDQITAGWSKYNEEVASVQTLMNSTGKSIEDIEGYLDELRWFSDETSYGFSQMGQALSMMTSSGGDIEKLIPMIEGIANATAYAGKGANEFSRTIYNLSQSYGTGHLQLIDWKSIEQAGVGSKQLKQTLIDVAEELGKIEKNQINVGTFNETLQKGWADQEVMEKGFGRFAEMTQKAYEMVQQGMVDTASEAYEILGETYNDFRIAAARSAQEAKTFSEAIDATKDAVSSTWSTTFKMIVGNYVEAKELWTNVANELWEIFAATGNARNEMLKQWKDMGGRDKLIQALANAYRDLRSVVEPLVEAFRELFPPTTAEGLYNLTSGFEKFTKQLKLSDEAAYTLKVTVKALLLPFKLIFEVMKIGVTLSATLFIILFKMGDAFLALFSKVNPLGPLFEKILGNERYIRFSKALDKIISNLKNDFSKLVTQIRKLIPQSNKLEGSFSWMKELDGYLKPIKDGVLDAFVSGFEKLSKINFNSISNFGKNVLKDILSRFKLILDIFSPVINSIKSFFISFNNTTAQEKLAIILDAFRNLKAAILDLVRNSSIAPVFEEISEKGEGSANIFKKLGEAITDFMSKLTPSRILVFSFGVALTGLMLTLSSTLKTFSGLLSTSTMVLKSLFVASKPSKISQIATALSVLAGALTLMSLVKPENLKQVTVTMLEMMGAFTIMIGIMAALDKYLIDSKSFSKVAGSIQALGLALTAMSSSIYILGKTDFDEDLVKKVALLGVLMLALSSSSLIISKFPITTTKNAVVLVAFAIAIGAVVNSLKKIANTDISGIMKSLEPLGVIIATLAALSIAASKTTFGAAAGITLLIGDILFIAEVLKKLSSYDAGSLVSGLVGFIPVMYTIASLMAVTLLAGKNAGKAGIAIGLMSGSILLLSKAIRDLGSLDKSAIIKGTAAVSALLIAFGFITAMTKFSRQNATKAGLGIMAMSASILLLELAINALGKLNKEAVIQGTHVVSSLLTLFGIIMAVGGAAKKSSASIMAMTAAIGILVSGIVILTMLPEKEVKQASEAMSKILASLALAMGAFSLVMKSVGSMSVKAFSVKMLVMTGVIGTAVWGISEIIDKLSKIKTDNTILQKTTAMSEILLASSAMVGVLIAVAKGMSVILINKDFYIKMGVILGTMGVALSALTGIIAILSQIPADNSIITKASAISEILLACSAAFAISTAFKVGDPQVALVALASIGILLLELQTIILLFGELMQKEGAQKIVQDGVGFFRSIGDAIGGFIGGIIEGVKNGLLSGEGLGKKISTFMTDLQPFFDMTANIKAESIIGVKNVASALKSLMKAVPREGGFLESFSGKIDFESFVSNLSSLIVALERFAGIGDRVGSDSAESSAKVGEAVASLLDAFPRNGGVIKYIIGEVDFDAFGSQLTKLGTGIYSFSKAVSKGIDVEAVQNATNAGEIIATLYDKLPNDGGWFQTVFGSKDLSIFGSQLTTLAGGLYDYSSIITFNGGIDNGAVKSSANSASMLAKLYEKLPTDGGWFHTIFGSKRLDEFGNQLVDLAHGLYQYSYIITKNDVIDNKTIEASSIAAQMLIDLQSMLTRSGGFIQKIAGEKDLSEFASGVKSLGEALYDYYEQIKDIEFYKIESSINTTLKLASSELSTDFIDGLISGLDISTQDVIDKMNSIAEAIVQEAYDVFALRTSGRRSSYNYSERFKNLGSYLVIGIIKGIESEEENIGNVVAKLANSLVTRFQKELEIESPSKVMRDEVGRYIVQGVADGISSDMSAEEAAERKASNIVSAFKVAFDKLDLKTKTMDLEEELWTALNPNASESEIQQRQKTLLDEKLKFQAEAVRNAEAEYQTTIKVLGETHDKTTEAYQKLLQEKIEMAKLASELAGDSAKTVADPMVEYAKRMSEQEDLMKMGFTEEQIRYWAETMSGYTPGEVKKTIDNDLQTALNSGDIESIMNAYLSPIPDVIVEVVDTGIQNGSKSAKSGGAAISNSIAEGVSENSGSITNAISNAINGITGSDDTKKSFTGSGAAIVDGIVSGIGEKASGAFDKAKDIGKGMLGKFNNVLGIQSPSKEFYNSGTYIVDGLINGIDDKSDDLNNKLSNMADSALKSMESVSSNVDASNSGQKFVETFSNGIESNISIVDETISNMFDSVIKKIDEYDQTMNKYGENLGSQMINGLVKGVENEKSKAINSIVSIAKASYEAAKKSLDIQSPSKKFEQLGKFISLGFALGISGESGRVADASDILVNKTLDTVSSAILHANNIIEDQKYSPIIKPVLDLQQIQDDLQYLDNSYSMGLAGTVSSHVGSAKNPYSYNFKAYRDNYTSNSRGQYTFDSIGGTAKNVDRQGNITFIQNNTSPKALSQSEIYRQTKNQLSTIKSSTGIGGKSASSSGK